jgi:hypothetical protein
MRIPLPYPGWIAKNRLRAFPSWEAEIAYAESLGYQLLHPMTRLPRGLSGEQELAYVMRQKGIDVWKGPPGKLAQDYGYPIFRKLP